MTLYAIGDIHGQYDMLIQALALIEADGGKDAKIVFLGDYTDRGPRSRDVVDFLINGQEQGRNWVLLKGNHDRMFEWFLRTPSLEDPHLFHDLTWLHERLGGMTTLASYGVDTTGRPRRSDLQDQARSLVPKAHVDFLTSLPLTYETDTLFFTHAGIRPGIPLADQSENDLIWIREDFVNDTSDHAKLIVHGHTAVDAAQHYGNRVNLDSGAGYGRPLTAAAFCEGQVFALTPSGRQPLLPTGPSSSL